MQSLAILNFCLAGAFFLCIKAAPVSSETSKVQKEEGPKVTMRPPMFRGPPPIFGASRFVRPPPGRFFPFLPIPPPHGMPPLPFFLPPPRPFPLMMPMMVFKPRLPEFTFTSVSPDVNATEATNGTDSNSTAATHKTRYFGGGGYGSGEGGFDDHDHHHHHGHHHHEHGGHIVEEMYLGETVEHHHLGDRRHGWTEFHGVNNGDWEHAHAEVQHPQVGNWELIYHNAGRLHASPLQYGGSGYGDGFGHHHHHGHHHGHSSGGYGGHHGGYGGGHGGGHHGW